MSSIVCVPYNMCYCFAEVHIVDQSNLDFHNRNGDRAAVAESKDVASSSDAAVESVETTKDHSALSKDDAREFDLISQVKQNFIFK